MRPLFTLLLGIAGVAYPFWVYISLEHASPIWVMLPLAVLWLLRTLTARQDQPGGRLLPCLLLLCCLVLALLDSEASLRAYPVLMSLLMLGVFAHSLCYGRPIIERLARLRHPELPPQGVHYTRRLTQIWCVFFAANASVAAGLGIWGSWRWWTLYNGAISYGLVGLLVVGERLVRPFFSKAA